MSSYVKNKFNSHKKLWETILGYTSKQVKAARASYFDDITLSRSHSPKVLFETVIPVLNSAVTVCSTPTSVTPDGFLSYFAKKIQDVRSAISLPNDDPFVLPHCCATLSEFEPVFLAYIKDLVNHTKSSACPRKIVPTWLLKDMLDWSNDFLDPQQQSSLCFCFFILQTCKFLSSFLFYQNSLFTTSSSR